MTKEEIFDVWSPEGSIWSTWVKPVLFAHMSAATIGSPLDKEPRASLEMNWAPAAQGRFALVLDLPCDEGVWLGLSLACLGYRPVPLYNALPLPPGVPAFDPVSQRPVAAVDVLPIINSLQHGAKKLTPLHLPGDAPPAFLLDANRQANHVRVLPDEFDNRSVCFTTDFPSANYLKAHGIQRVLLVQRQRIEPQNDLAHVLRRWQEGGLPLQRVGIADSSEPENFQVKRPAWFGVMFQRVLVAMGLRRAPAGGFGAWIPESSGG